MVVWFPVVLLQNQAAFAPAGPAFASSQLTGGEDATVREEQRNSKVVHFQADHVPTPVSIPGDPLRFYGESG